MKKRKAIETLVGKLIRIDEVDFFIGNCFDETEGSVCLYYDSYFTYYENTQEREGVVLSDSEANIYNYRVAELMKDGVIVLELITNVEVNECLKAKMIDIPRNN